MDYKQIRDNLGNAVYKFIEKIFPNSFEKRARDSKFYRNLETNLQELESNIFNLSIDLESEKNKGVGLENKLNEARAVIGNRENRIDELSRLYAHQKKLNYRNLHVETVFNSLLKIPIFKKLPILIVDNSGIVYAQTSKSRQEQGSLIGINISRYLDCKTPGARGITLDDKAYRGYVFPLEGNKAFDYSLIHLRQEKGLSKIMGSKKYDEQAQKLICSIARKIAELNASVDLKIKSV
jgi:hypothetical protein